MDFLHFDMSKPRDIVALGRSNVDIYPNEFGFMNDIKSFTKYVGGSPANTSVQMAKMGIDCAFISKISQDHFGRFVKYYMESQGVDGTCITEVKDPTIRHGVAVAEQPEMGNINYFFYRKNCADLFIEMDDVKEEFIAQFKGLLISGTSLCQSPAREAVFLAIEYAKRNNVRVIFDPDYRPSEWRSPQETALYYWMVATQSDYIFGTREELDIVELLQRPDNQDDDVSAAELLKFTPSLVCIKRGEDGSNVYLKDGSIVHGQIYPTRLYKVLGAGDSFAGTFLSQLCRDYSIADSLKYAAAAASLTIAGKACSASMPKRAMVESYLKAYEEGTLESWPGWDEITKANQSAL